MRTTIIPIPHKSQRYATVGDYFYNKNGRQIRVSQLENEWHEELVGIHEYVESVLAKRWGIREEDITDFDVAFEKSRRKGVSPCGCKPVLDEPGDDIHAPYYKAHQVATIVERIVALELGMDWETYNNGIEEK